MSFCTVAVAGHQIPEDDWVYVLADNRPSDYLEMRGHHTAFEFRTQDGADYVRVMDSTDLVLTYYEDHLRKTQRHDF